MRLSKAQHTIVEALQNGGHIWLAAGHPYLSTADSAGRVTSKSVNSKVFNSLKDGGIIDNSMDGKYRLKEA